VRCTRVIQQGSDLTWKKLKVGVLDDNCQQNVHLSLEEYYAELERMNAAIMAENQTLQHDNKQLGVLIKEYEQTLESVMS